MIRRVRVCTIYCAAFVRRGALSFWTATMSRCFWSGRHRASVPLFRAVAQVQITHAHASVARHQIDLLFATEELLQSIVCVAPIGLAQTRADGAPVHACSAIEKDGRLHVLRVLTADTDAVTTMKITGGFTPSSSEQRGLIDQIVCTQCTTASI